jgi:hypothetical protein
MHITRPPATLGGELLPFDGFRPSRLCSVVRLEDFALTISRFLFRLFD